jgi:hypothetical protein
MRGMGRIFKRANSAHWWIAFYLRGKEFRESSGSPNQKDAEKLLTRISFMNFQRQPSADLQRQY